MSPFCLVCNAQGLDLGDCVADVFAEDNNQFPTGSILKDVLSEILNKSLDQTAHSRVLCCKCLKLCQGYDEYKLIINKIKCDMIQGFENTANIFKTNNTINTLPVKKIGAKIVVPASKLQPVPPDFQFKLGKFPAVSNANSFKILQPQTPLINLKVTIGSSVLTQSLATSTVKICKPLDTTIDKPVNETSNDLTEWILPNELFSMQASSNDIKNEIIDGNNDLDSDEGNNDAWSVNDSMEIDENNGMGQINMKSEPTDDDNTYINVKVLSECGDGTDTENLLKKLKLLENDEDGPHTIVVDGDNASILEMMAGQKLIFENGELSLVMQNNEDVGNDDALGDSNDEDAQIELQMSGDEETANAIIAAAQEQGGAFIKMKSGEMYRVKSVQSQPAQLGSPALHMVARDGDNYRCLLCDRMKETLESVEDFIADSDDILKHLKAAHGATLYICQLCGLIMRKRNEYATHIAEHTKKLTSKSGQPTKTKLHTCDVCEKGFTSKTLLQEHINVHTGTRPYECNICSKTFASKYTHQSHLKTHQNRPRPFKCKQCNKSFLSQQNLNQHEKTHLGIKNFVCNICNKAFGTQHNLEVHGVVHSGERAHCCSHCGKRFARKAELIDHQRTHTGERPFACDLCSARFAQRSNLHSHRRATHLHDKRHACTHCDKRFKRRRLLDYHIKATHTGERAHRCGVCGASFVYPEHYKKHVKIHSGEKPYYCEICGKSFNSRDNRNTHRFVHSDKKPYECLACGASYMRKRQLVAHMNSTGHLTESIVVNQPRVTRVNENGVSTVVNLKSDDGFPDNIDSDAKAVETIFRTSGELKLLADNSPTKLDEAKLFITSTDNMKIIENGGEYIQTIDASEFTGNTAQVTNENGAILRLIQVKLPDGNDGWVALDD